MTKKPLIARDTGQPLVVMGWAAQELKRLFVLHGHRLTFVTVRRARDRSAMSPSRKGGCARNQER
jgi:hypothetical protein